MLARSPACLATTFAFFKVFCLRRGRRGTEKFTLARGAWCVPDAGAECKGSRPCNGWEWCVPDARAAYEGNCPYEGGRGAYPKPRLLGNNLCFLQSVLPPAGKAGAAWGCRPTEHPLPTPAGNPAGLSGRPLLAWFGRLLGRADTHHSCSQRPLRRDDLRATPRAPQGNAKPRDFGR